MSIHKLFAILVALAVLFAPGVSTAAMAALPQHDMQMMEAGHCAATHSNMDHRDKMDGKTCCISMCLGVAVAPTAPFTQNEVRPAPAIFAISALHLSHLGEIATPPPRTA